MKIGPQVLIRYRGKPKAEPLGQAQLEKSLQRASQYFAEHLGPVKQPLEVEVGAQSDGLRTGYNYQTQRLCFPNLGGVHKAGTESADVVHHEAFHGLVVQNYPHTAKHLKDPQGIALHEGLADYFAYLLEPDSHFGEGYLLNEKPLRKYQNDLAFNLAAGPHAQGSVITRHLINNQVTPAQLRTFLESEDFSLKALAKICPSLAKSLERDRQLDLREVIQGYPPSTRRRYRIQSEVPLQVELQPSAAIPWRVEWTGAKGAPVQFYDIQPQAEGGFAITARPGARAEKVLAHFYSEDRLVGFRPYYLSPEG